jgi:hypothetical protein
MYASISEENAASTFYPEDGDSEFFRKVDTRLQWRLIPEYHNPETFLLTVYGQSILNCSKTIISYTYEYVWGHQPVPVM